MANKFVLGKDGVLTIGETEVTSAKDVTISIEANEIDVTTRGNDGWKAVATSLKEGTIEWEMVVGADGDATSSCYAALINNTQLTITVSSGGVGLSGNFVITSIVQNEPIGDAITAKVTAKYTSAVESEPEA
ncbi:MAG: phage tail tube protein [Phycisphaerae bacterium]|jgi:hypothetical protein